jgi:hypothetical protein
VPTFWSARAFKIEFAGLADPSKVAVTLTTPRLWTRPPPLLSAANIMFATGLHRTQKISFSTSHTFTERRLMSGGESRRQSSVRHRSKITRVMKANLVHGASSRNDIHASRLRRFSCSITTKSAFTISTTKSSKVVLGLQPSLARALLESPRRVSTSVARK